jgi:hypothetical protein
MKLQFSKAKVMQSDGLHFLVLGQNKKDLANLQPAVN